jgi:hypothetical protein
MTGTPEDADNHHWTLSAEARHHERVRRRSQGRQPRRHQPALDRRAAGLCLQHQFVMLNKIPQLRGVTPWVLMDFRSPTRNIPKLQDGYNRKGLISEDGKKKQAFFTLQQAYAIVAFITSEIGSRLLYVLSIVGTHVPAAAAAVPTPISSVITNTPPAIAHRRPEPGFACVLR